jgi:hypothetical protein
MSWPSDYRDLFLLATGVAPYLYQERLATDLRLPSVLLAPTGLGKTQAVLTAWLHRRLGTDTAVRNATPGSSPRSCGAAEQ